MKVIVSITPLPVMADSRTYKIAASFARFGYRSIVVEGERSEIQSDKLPFELRSRPASAKNREKVFGEQTKHQIQDGAFYLKHIKRFAKRLPASLQNIIKTAYFTPRILYQYNAGLARVIQDASLYYLHSPYQFLALEWATRGKKTPFIYDAHDFYSVIFPNLYFARLERRCIRRAEAVVTVSDGIGDLIQKEYGCPPIIVRNCQDKRIEGQHGLDLRKALGISDESFLIVSVGQAKPGQAIAEALEALVELPPAVHLALVGKNTIRYKEVVNRIGLESRVHLVPPVKPNEVVTLIRCADAALILYYPFSSNYEYCLPNGFFQSISAELPLLYPELTEIKNLAEKYSLGIPIDPKSPKSIERAILKLMNDQHAVNDIKRNLHAVNDLFSWEREEAILRDLVMHILDKNKGKRI